VKILLVISFLFVGLGSALAQNKKIVKVKVRDSQEVNFDELSLQGTIRSPEGAYLVQKRGIRFMPLYDVQKNLDAKIRDSVEYVR
jgi:hypothetical protein